MKKLALLLMAVITLTGCGISRNDNGDYILNLWDQEEFTDENIPDMEWSQDDPPDEDYIELDEIDEGFLIESSGIDTSINPYWERKETTKFFGKDRIKLKEVTPLTNMWQFCINNTVITMPCSVKDLVDAGCILEPPVGMSTVEEIIPANCMSYLVTLRTEAPNGELLYMHALIDNMKDYECSIYNRTIYSLDIFSFNTESQYRNYNFYMADGVGFDNKYYDAYDYFVEDPSDDDYTNFESYPAYTITTGQDSYIRWEGLNHDDWLDSVSWRVGNHSEEIVPDEEFELLEKKYSKDDLPEYMEYTGLSEGLMFDNEFTLNGVDITLPCSIGDLLSAGYLPKDKVSSETEIFKYDRFEIEFVEDGAPENTLVATVANWGDESVTMADDCVHIIRFNCKQYYDNSTTVMVKLGNGMTPYVDLITFIDHFGVDHLIEGESYSFQTVFRTADPPAGFDGTFFNVVEYVFDGQEEDSKLMSILIGADLPSGISY